MFIAKEFLHFQILFYRKVKSEKILMIAKDEKLRKKIQYDVNKWPKMSTSDLLPVYIKGIKFLIFTKSLIVEVLPVPIT